MNDVMKKETFQNGHRIWNSQKFCCCL